jgi:hypothetical protein
LQTFPPSKKKQHKSIHTKPNERYTFRKMMNFGKLDFRPNGFFCFAAAAPQRIVMARTKMTARLCSGGLWSDRRRYKNYFKEERRALDIETEPGLKAACHLTSGAFAQAGDLLRDPGILQEVCKYLIGHSVYVSLVCKSWRHCYEIAAAESELTIVAEEADDIDSDDGEEDQKALNIQLVWALHVTLYSAAFATATTVKYAQENGLGLTEEAVTRSAGKHGSLEALAEFYELDGKWDSALTNGAAARGSYDITYLLDHGTYSACTARRHCQDLAQHLILRKRTATTECISSRLICSIMLCNVFLGNLKLLQFLLRNRCPHYEQELADAAARSGSLQLFAWLLNSGTVTNEQHTNFITDTLIAAVEVGHLHMCKHLLQLRGNSNPTVYTELVVYAAAKTRNKHLLQWLVIDSGLTVSEAELFQYATEVPKQDLATVLWLLEQGYALPTDCYTGVLLPLKL